MNRRLGGDASLNAPIRDDGEAGEWQDWLVDNSPNQEAVMAEHEEFDHRRQALNGAIGVLNPRERRIFEARRLAEDPMTLEDLAAEFGVSRERVRQIEVRAFEKVQSAVKGTIARRKPPRSKPRTDRADRKKTKAGGNAGFFFGGALQPSGVASGTRRPRGLTRQDAVGFATGLHLVVGSATCPVTLNHARMSR